MLQVCLYVLQKLERKDAEAEGVRKEMRMKTTAGLAPSRPGPKKPRKNAANNSSVVGSEATATDAGQKKPRGATKRAPAKQVDSIAVMITSYLLSPLCLYSILFSDFPVSVWWLRATKTMIFLH